jgi:cysteine desulfurase
MLYLDNSATTRVHDEVFQAMLPYLQEEYGNPSSKYYTLAENAKRAVNEARESVAALVGCEPDEVVFTSGATESNNMIIKGVAHYYSNNGKHIITSKTEHPSVLETCRFLERIGYKITYLDVDKYGRILIEDLLSAIHSEPPILVTLLWGNNELGSLNDIEKISMVCEEKNIMFHTDATQIIGKVKFNLSRLKGVRFLSFSGHKIHGPKGVGVAVIRKDNIGKRTKITPLLHGGGQEFEYRSGTLAVHNIVGIGKAAEIAARDIDRNISKLTQLEKRCRDLLISKFGDQVVFNSDSKNKIPGILNFLIKGVNNQRFIIKHSDRIALSTGSACSSTKPSHVLQAIGKTENEIRSTLRITLSADIELKELEVINNL